MTQTGLAAPPAKAEPQGFRSAAPQPVTEFSTPVATDPSQGPLGPFQIGPVLGTGLPNVLSLGLTSKFERYFGVGFNLGVIPKFRISYYGDATVSYLEYDIYGRVYPFGGPIFIGTGVGYATVHGTLKNTFDLTPYQALVPGLPATYLLNSAAMVHTLILTPQIGLFHTFDSGFSLGFELGAQLPIASSQVNFTTHYPPNLPQPVIDQVVTPNDQKVRSTLQTIGRTPIPTAGIFVGWLL